MISGLLNSMFISELALLIPLALAAFQMASCIIATYWAPLRRGMDLGSLLKVYFEENENLVLPMAPRLVLMRSTPLAPFVP